MDNTPAQQEEEKTIETQISAVKEFADKTGYKIVQEYRDDGWSGDILARPALDQLRMDAKRRMWDAILIYDPDRLVRRAAWQEIIMEELKELGIEVLFATVPVPKNDEDVIMYKMRGVFVEYERMKIKERFRLGKVRKAKERHIILTEAPYGYNFIQKTDKKQGYLEKNEAEAEVVRDMFHWVANEKLTLRGVARRLQELGIKPRWSERGVWNTSTLSSLFKNTTYVGEGHYGASYAIVPEKPFKSGGYKKNKKISRKMKPQEEWIKIPTPTIIDKDLFEKARMQLQKNFELCQRNRRNSYLLAGKIWCICGSRRTGEGPMKGKHLYYRCSNRVKSFPLKRTCFEKGTNARIADDLVWREISAIVSSKALLAKKAKEYLGKRSRMIPSASIDIEKIHQEITKLKSEEDRYNKAYGASLFSIDQLKEYIGPIKARTVVLGIQIAKSKMAKEEVEKPTVPSLKDLELFTEKSKEEFRGLNFSEKQGILQRVITKIIATQRELIGHGIIDISNLSYVKFKTSDRNSWFAERR